jgi:hypothetical protein
VLEISHDDPVAHCSVTSYAFDPSVGRRGGLALEAYNVVEPLVEEDEPVTTREDAPAAAG